MLSYDPNQRKSKDNFDGSLIPIRYQKPIDQFLLDKKTGNITINVKNGCIRGLKFEIHYE